MIITGDDPSSGSPLHNLRVARLVKCLSPSVTKGARWSLLGTMPIYSTGAA